MGKAPDSFPVTYTASPQLKDGAIPAPTWQYWAITDCKKELVPWWQVIFAVERAIYVACHGLNDVNGTM